ncbi:MAG TPA: efflux RND transporter periplasmic adaptor subunit [Ignavibacteriaceae bacterium]|nr:efflux RND transporter periplasmic adaptor subunit [Ignavibacteriaceae bacterium]
MDESKKTLKNYLQTALELLNKYLDKLDAKLKKSKLPDFLKNGRLVASGALVIFLILIFFVSSVSGGNSNVPVYKVKKDNFLVSVTESGEIQAKNATSISAPRIRGQLKIVNLVAEGTYVKPGDIVAQFDPSEALTNLKDAQSKLDVGISDKKKLIATQQADLTGMESALKTAELQFELSKLSLEQIKFEADIKQREAKLNHQKNELMLKKAKQDLESKKIVQQSELDKMNIEIEQKKADRDKAQKDLDQLTLKAPKEGLVVYENNWSTGRKFAIGDTPWGGQPVISLPDLSAMESKTFVNEVDVSKVKKGQEVLITLDAFQDSTFKGKISSIAALGKNKSKDSQIKVFEVLVQILSKSDILKPGMTTSNKLIINQVSNVLYVPQEAVFEKDGKKIVFIKSGAGFDEEEVEVGEKSDNFVVIKKGLESGDEVALRDPNLKIDGTEISSDNSNSVSLPAGGN